MKVSQLRAELANMPDDADVVVAYEANCCLSDDLAVGLLCDGRVEINADGLGHLLEDIAESASRMGS